MNKQDAIKDAVNAFDKKPGTYNVVRRGSNYAHLPESCDIPRGWRIADIIGPGNVQNYRAQPTTAAAREHLPACGFLRSGKDQTACNCAALLAALDEREDAPPRESVVEGLISEAIVRIEAKERAGVAEHTNRIYRSSMEEIVRLRSDVVSNGWRVGPIWGSGGRYYFDFTPIAETSPIYPPASYADSDNFERITRQLDLTTEDAPEPNSMRRIARIMDGKDASPARLTFKLEIRLGNDAMRTYNDIGDALQRVAAVMFRHDTDEPVRSANPVRDANGDNVGKWEVRDDSVEAVRSRIIAEDGPYA